MDDQKRRSQRRFPLREWWQIFLQANDRIADHNLSLISAGVAFFSMLALFPAIAATISLYGYFSDPSEVLTNLQLLEPVVPDAVYKIIYVQVTKLITTPTSALGITSILSILFAIWSARAGVFSMITGLNIVYRTRVRRNYFRRVVLAYVLTFVLIGVAIVAIGAVVILPTIMAFVPLGPVAGFVVQVLRWSIAMMTILAGIGILYRYGPNLKENKIPLFSAGSFLASILWVVVSSLFSVYLSNFGQYNEVYGSLGAVIAMLLWFYISSWVVFLGAELNAEINHHRTFGPPDGGKGGSET
jgi:membrane protein